MRRQPQFGKNYEAMGWRNRRLGGFDMRVLRSAGLIVMALTLGACSTFRGESTGGLTGEDVEDVNWSFADAAELQAEIDQLKGENEKLKQEIIALERQKKTAAAVQPAENLGVAALRDSVETLSAPISRPASGSNGSGKTIVAAANAEQAIADATVPVEAAPRLVQPSFTSDTQEIFENEAPFDDNLGEEIKLSSILYGVHLASYRRPEEARQGWRKLQRENPDELGLLEPRVDRVSVKDKGVFLRLIGGGFSSRDKAATLCENLKSKGLYCAIAGFDGERLSLAGAG